MRFFVQKHIKKGILVVAFVIVFVLMDVGGTGAFLLSKPDPIANHFTPAFVTCEVEETFQNGVKQDVSIRNTGNVAAYIRAAVVITFQDADGTVLASAPKEGVDYTIAWAQSGWTKGADGFWYHGKTVAPNATTVDLIETAKVISAPDGYDLVIQIAATAIQADPMKAVEQAWNVTVSNKTVIPLQ